MVIFNSYVKLPEGNPSPLFPSITKHQYGEIILKESQVFVKICISHSADIVWNLQNVHMLFEDVQIGRWQLNDKMPTHTPNISHVFQISSNPNICFVGEKSHFFHIPNLLSWCPSQW